MAYIKKKPESKQEVAYQYIKKAIMENKFAPNSMLVETALCNILGFSKTPIREALRRLTSEDLVKFIPEKGCFISVLTFKELVNIFDLREALEGMATRLGAQRRVSDLVERLEKENQDIKKYLELEDTDAVLKHDEAFHDIMIQASMNNKLIGFVDAINVHIRRIRGITKDDYERLRLSVSEHDEVTRALRNSHPEAAEAAMRAHIRSIKSFMINKHYLIDSDYLLVEKPH